MVNAVSSKHFSGRIVQTILALFLAVPACRGQTAERRARVEEFVGSRQSSSNSAAEAFDLARRQHLAMLAQPRSSILTAPWTAVGPNQVATAEFGNVTGRVTAIAIDPADSTGNTVYVGTTGGGVWKSTNASGPAGSVVFVPLTDTLPVFDAASQTVPSLSIGSLAVAHGVLLAGTGDPNDATDSYYGAGILRSADGGLTWTVAQQSNDGAAGKHSFFGLSVAGLAFSTTNPTLAVAALSQAAEGAIVSAPIPATSEMGLYYSTDAGQTWQMATILDGSQTVQTPNTVGNSGGGNAVTSVVWNPIRQRFYAAVRSHGFYMSTDGITWTRLTNQPATGLTAVACPANSGTSGSASCPIFRGVLAVQPTSGDMFALSVDAANNSRGLFQDVCALSGAACGNTSATFGTALNATPLQQTASSVIPQADYNLALAATPSGTDTILFAGTTDLYRCSLAAGCSFRNTTNALNGCTNPARVAPSQHALAALGSLLFVGNDGGVWRSTDGVAQLAPPCALDDANHFQNLNAGFGSLAETVSFAQSPTDPATLLAGFGALGTAGTSVGAGAWAQLATGEGGTVAIDPANPNLRYLSTGAGISVASCAQGSACAAADFASPVIGPAQVSGDAAAAHAPWLLDPGFGANLIAGTCRVWRGPVAGGSLWSTANAIASPFATPALSACGSNPPLVRSLAAGGPSSSSTNAQNAGSRVLYAGLAGILDGGQGLGGHLFVTSAANLAGNTTAWTDAAKSPVVNDPVNASIFNPNGFDISAVTVDPHDATGATVYATVMGFGSAPHLYRSIDTGAHWTNISANLPNAPANAVLVDPNDANTLYVALDSGVYATTQVATCASANCWSAFGTSLPNSPVTTLAAAAAMPTGDGRTGELRAGTYGRGIWQIPLLTASAPATPAITLNPSTVTFPTQQVATSSLYAPITVTNTGTATLTVTSIVTSSDFKETDTCIGAPVLQGGSCVVQVAFLPMAVGNRSGLLTVYANVPGGQATAALSGIGTAAAVVVLTPLNLTFPSTNVGATSAPQAITISNTGANATTLQPPIITGDFAISANSCGSTLGPGSGCTLLVVFAPTVSGTRSGSITVVDGAGTQVATLMGTATNPATDTLAPVALTFAAQQLGTSSAAQQVTLTNAGDVALTLIATQIVSGDFNVVNGCGNSLAAHSSCAITVTYTPKSIGAQTGTLVVADQFRAQTVSLSGVGLAPPGVSLSPTNGLVFAATGVGQTAAAQTVTLTNNGGVPLSLTGVAVAGDFSLLPGTNTCGISVAPAAICTVQIAFSPTVAGLRTGTVTFSDNATNSPQSLSLSGTGIDFTLASNGPSSATISSGGTATYALLLTSVAGLPGNAALTCAGVPIHSTCTVNPSAPALGGATTVSVTVATGLAGVELHPPDLPWTRQLIWLALILPLVFCGTRRKVRLPALLLLVAMSGCSTGRTIPGQTSPGTTVVTTSGTYTLVVAASSAGLVRSVNLTLVVQ
jgi:hypothetical protein